MPTASGLAGWFTFFLLLTAIGTWLARRYALARRLVDEPGERRSHVIPTPRGGGIAIVGALLAALVALIVMRPESRGILLPATAGLLLVAMIGWIDDHRPLSPWLRLVVHVVGAGLLGAGCLLVGQGTVAALVAFALALVLVNAWNFMDGINGLAVSQAALVSMACLAMAPAPSSGGGLFGLALLAACLGFLPFNFPSARIFLGDVGSGAVGYALALLLALAGEGQLERIWLILPLSAFLLDTALTLGARIVRRERWWTPHVQHLYQRLARQWSGHTGVTLAYAGWTVASVWLAWCVRSGGLVTIMGAVFIWYALGAAIWLAARRVQRLGAES